jgi:hypothetical protein
MRDPKTAALAALRSIRHSRGYASLPSAERDALDRDFMRISAVLSTNAPQPSNGLHRAGSNDPFAIPLETPNGLRDAIGQFGPGLPAGRSPSPEPTPAAPATEEKRPTSPIDMLGGRARMTLEAVDFPSFFAGLIQGTFQAIVDATAQQVREYAKLVADISKSVDEFTRDNVTDNQARDHLHERHGRDLALQLPSPGSEDRPRIVPRSGAEESPSWLAEYGLAGEELTPELADGPLVTAGRRALGEERLRTLATLVLMGVNRIVVDDGQLRARLNFHARARETSSAEIAMQAGGQQIGIAARSAGMQSAVSTMVSTVDVNTQADSMIKADLVGEVAVRFRTETFDLQRFADSRAIGLISRHALTRDAADTPAGASPTPSSDGGDAT